MKKYIPFLLLVVVILSACTASSSSLTGTWRLVAYGPEESMTPAVSDAEAILTFGEDGAVGANSGCNSMGGEYQVEGNKITFSEMTSTLMACDDDRMAQESAFAQALNGTATFEIEDNTLAITNGDMVLVFSSAPAE